MSLKITAACLLAVSAVFGAETAFEKVKYQNIYIRNPSTVPVTLDVLSKYVFLELAKTSPNGRPNIPVHRMIEAAPGAVLYGESDGQVIDCPQEPQQVSNYDQSPIFIGQKHTITIPAGSIKFLGLTFPHYFSGIKGATNFAWQIASETPDIKESIMVNLGGAGVRGPANQNFVSTPQDLNYQLDLYKKYFMDGRDASYTEILQDFMNQGSGVLQTKRTEEVIVSLTSYPARFATTWLAIESLLRQEERPDRVNINLFEGEFPGRVLPWFIRQQMKRGLEVNWCPENLKVYLKVVPTVQKFPEAAVVATDDDVIYDDDNLKDLYQAYLRKPNCVITRDVRIPYFSNGVIYPIQFWNFTGYQLESSVQVSESVYNIPESVSMTLFPAGSLNKEYLFNRDISQRVCPTDDDLWLYACSILNNFKVYKVERTKRRISLLDWGPNDLYAVNSSNDFEKLNLAYSRLVKLNEIRNILGSFVMHPMLDRESTLEQKITDCNFSMVNFEKPRIEKLDYLFNSSIIEYNDKYVMAHRVKLQNDPFDKIVICLMDKNFKIELTSIIFQDGVSFEDPRLMLFKNKLYMYYVKYNNNWELGTQIIFSELDNSLRVLSTHTPDIGGNRITGKFEKNWLCYEHQGSINIIYSLQPLVIYQSQNIDGAFREIIRERHNFSDWAFGEVRASVGPIFLNGYIYILYHSHMQKRTTSGVLNRLYFNGIAKYDTNFKLLSYSKKPYLMPPYNPHPKNYAYCVLPYGFILKNKKIYICAGVNDFDSILLEISEENFSDLFSVLSEKI